MIESRRFRNMNIEAILQLSGTYQEIFDQVEVMDGEFWCAVEDLVCAGWGIPEFKHTDIENTFVNLDIGIQKSWKHLEKRCLSVEKARKSGDEWMKRIFDVIDKSGEREPWYMLDNRKDFIHALQSLEHEPYPPRPEYPETDVIYDGAWRRLVSEAAMDMIGAYNDEAVIKLSFESAVPGFRNAYPYGRFAPFKLINEERGIHIGFFSSIKELCNHLDVLEKIERTYVNESDRF